MGIIGLGYSRGLTGAWWSLIGGIALIPFGLFLASRVRALNVYTLPDILKNAYGHRVALTAGIMIALAWCGVISAQLIAGGRLLCSFLPLDFRFALGIVAIVFIAYTFWGGATFCHQDRFLAAYPFCGGPFRFIGLPGYFSGFPDYSVEADSAGAPSLSRLKHLWLVRSPRFLSFDCRASLPGGS